MAITRTMSGSIMITGLSIGANTIPHGLPATPQMVQLRPGLASNIGYGPTDVLGRFWTQPTPADSTNFYVTVVASAPLAGIIDFWLPEF